MSLAPRLGKYRLLARLGAGGMAEVLLGRLDGPGGFVRNVAIKRMRRELARSREFVELFLEEARTASRLTHPNVCAVLELGEVDGGEPYMVLEYLDGVSLASVLAQQMFDPRRWDLPELVGIVAQACEGVHHAHECKDEQGGPLGLVHRDVSPPNLFLTEQGVVKVLDFGISKSRASVVRTLTGQIRGKFAYMSPEQLRGETLDRRSDVFSLGIVLAELLTGQRLFRRDNRLEVFKAIVREPIPSLATLRPELPPLLAAVADCALARERDARFDNARALAVALTAATRELGPPASPSTLAGLVAARFGRELTARAALLRDPPGLDDDPGGPVAPVDTEAATDAGTPREVTAVDLAAAADADGDEALAAALPPGLVHAVLGADDTT